MSTAEAKPYLAAIKPYQAGVCAGEIAPEINLASNENPYGAAPVAVQAMQAYLNQYRNHALNRYPDQASILLRKEIAKKYNLPMENLICGNGSDELISQIAMAYAGSGDEIIHSQYGFACYPLAAYKNGATPIAVPEHEFTLNCEDILAAITPKTKIIMLANPNNPTGFFINDAMMAKLHQKIPEHIILMIDAAYAEYVRPEENNAEIYDGGIHLAKQAKNILVTRTFSKAHGLAGLRVGWGYAEPNIIAAMLKISEPFNLNLFAQKIAAISLMQDDYIADCATKNMQMRDWLAQELRKLKITTLPSSGNFLLCQFSNPNIAYKVWQELKQAGILVRHTASMGLAHCLRITIGTQEELQNLLKQLSYMNGIT